MERPSKAQVEQALNLVITEGGYVPQVLGVLAAEVRALREDNKALVLVCADMLTKLASLEKLPALWRLAAASVNDPKSPSIFIECADDVERLL